MCIMLLRSMKPKEGDGRSEGEGHGSSQGWPICVSLAPNQASEARPQSAQGKR